MHWKNNAFKIILKKENSYLICSSLKIYAVDTFVSSIRKYIMHRKNAGIKFNKYHRDSTALNQFIKFILISNTLVK